MSVKIRVSATPNSVMRDPEVQHHALLALLVVLTSLHHDYFFFSSVAG
jgi:hypothetical protein